MKKFYYTFGSSLQFPFQNGYVIVEAQDIEESHTKFRKRFPDRNEDTLNCAFYYNEEEFTRLEINGMCHETIK